MNTLSRFITRPRQLTLVTTTRSFSKRKRHRFADQANVPSFHEFQQSIQIKALFRKFARLNKSLVVGQDIMPQVRHEFKQPLHDQFAIKRALSEGNRKYQELSGLMQAKTTGTSNMKWPWQKNS